MLCFLQVWLASIANACTHKLFLSWKWNQEGKLASCLSKSQKVARRTSNLHTMLMSIKLLLHHHTMLMPITEIEICTKRKINRCVDCTEWSTNWTSATKIHVCQMKLCAQTSFWTSVCFTFNLHISFECFSVSHSTFELDEWHTQWKKQLHIIFSRGIALLGHQHDLHCPAAIFGWWEQSEGHQWIAVDIVELNSSTATQQNQHTGQMTSVGWCWIERQCDSNIDDSERKKGSKKDKLGSNKVMTVGFWCSDQNCCCDLKLITFWIFLHACVFDQVVLLMKSSSVTLPMKGLYCKIMHDKAAFWPPSFHHWPLWLSFHLGMTKMWMTFQSLTQKERDWHFRNNHHLHFILDKWDALFLKAISTRWACFPGGSFW